MKSIFDSRFLLFLLYEKCIHLKFLGIILKLYVNVQTTHLMTTFLIITIIICVIIDTLIKTSHASLI